MNSGGQSHNGLSRERARPATVAAWVPIALRARPAIDRLARLAEAAVGGGAATISLVDATDQYLVGIAGTGGQDPLIRRLPAAMGLAGLTVDAEHPIYLEDAAADPRLVGHPMIGPDRTRAYAGVPLTDSDGVAIGSVCVHHNRVRAWSDQQRSALEAVADTVVLELELYRDIDRRQRLLDGFDEAPVAIVVTHGPEHVVDYTNAAYRVIFGPVPVGASIAVLTPRPLREFVDVMDQVLARGEGYADADREATTVWPGELRPRTRFFDVAYSTIHRKPGNHTPSGAGAEGRIDSGGGLLTVVVETTDKVNAQRDLHARARTQALLARASAALNRKLDPATELRELAEVVVPELADMSTVHVLAHPVAPGRMPPLPVTTDRVAVKMIPGVTPPPPANRLHWHGDGDPITAAILAGGLLRQPILTPDQPKWATDAGSVEAFRTGLNQVVLAPVIVDGMVIAVASFGQCNDRPTWTPTELDTLEQIAGYAGIALGHGLSYQHARESAMVLQHSMLTEPPVIPGLRICARYQPAGHDEVGGDWYDAFTAPLAPTTDERTHPAPATCIVLTVGDVVGHDINSAAAMGQLRSGLRCLTLDRSTGPGHDLDRLAAINTTLAITRFATLVHAHLRHDPTTDITSVNGAGNRAWTLRWANAGHPPPLLLTPDGNTHLLDQARGCALIPHPIRPHSEATHTLPAGSTLLLYTDGLVEKPGTDLDDNVTALRARITANAHLPTEQLCDELLTAAPAHDDVALLAIHITGR